MLTGKSDKEIILQIFSFDIKDYNNPARITAKLAKHVEVQKRAKKI